MPGNSLDHFTMFSALHFAVLGLVVVVATGLGWWRRRVRRLGVVWAIRADRQAGLVLLAIWVIEQAIEMLPQRFSVAESLPFHICDVAGLVAAAAVYTDRRGLRAMLYFWGIGLSSQAIIQPDLADGPTQAAFWVFWVPHGAIIAAAIYDLVGRRFRPTFKDAAFAYAAILIYAVLVLPIDLGLGVNYGFIGNVDHGPLDFLGPWPLRVFKCVVAAGALMAVMTLPWVIGQRLSKKNAHVASGSADAKDVDPRAAELPLPNG